MRKKIIAGLALSMLISMTSAAQSTTINYNSIDTSADKTSIYTYLDDFQMETFGNGPTPTPIGSASGLDQPWTWTGSASIVTGSVGGQYAAPFGIDERDQTNYLSVPNPNSTGSVDVIFSGEYDYFGLWWGSVDSYNSISFLYQGSVIESYSGSDAIDPNTANGNQGSQLTNVYVNFFTDYQFDAIRLSSTNFAFEVDNMAIGSQPIPEPATMLLFGTGLAGLIGSRVRRKK